MTQKKISHECKRPGTSVFIRCGHILHYNCFKSISYRRVCPKCETDILECFKAEEFIFKIKSSNLDFGTIFELIICLDNIASYQNIDQVCMSYDGKLLEQLQRLGWDINNESFGGTKLFYRACVVDNLDKVDLLIEHDFNLEKFGPLGLLHACKNSSYDVFDRLVARNVKLIQKVIFDLVNDENFEMLKHIIELGTDVNLIGEKGIRPIHYAAKIGSIGMVQLFIDNGADFNAVDKEENSIQHYACISKNGVELIEYFINSGFDFKIQNYWKQTPIMFAVENRNNRIINYFIQKKVGLKIICTDGDTPLHWCAVKGNYDLVKALLIEGADVNAKNKFGKTPLHVVGYNVSEVAGLLLDNGADMNALDDDGKSPLFYFHSEITEDLKNRFIDGGADLTIRNRDGKSILELILIF